MSRITDKEKKMTEAPRRPRVDTVCKLIADGSYDAKLSQISEAIEARNQERRKYVDDLVKEVYGSSFSVKPNTAPQFRNFDSMINKENTTTVQAENSGTTSVSNERSPATSASDLEAQMEAEIENRGAIIGGLE